jgi:hypothetical protein
MSLRLRIGDHVTDMFHTPIDLKIRYCVPEDATLLTLSLEPANRRVLCASPECLRARWLFTRPLSGLSGWSPFF